MTLKTAKKLNLLTNLTRNKGSLMVEVTGSMVKSLRDKTGLGMTKCLEALKAAGGDENLAIENLRKAGLSAGAKKSDREAKEGMIVTAEDANSIVLLEGNVESDFVANNENFKTFMLDIVGHALKTLPAAMADLLGQKHPKDDAITIEQSRNLHVAKLGENIVLSRVEVMKKSPNSSYGVYSHGNKLVVIVEIEGAADKAEVAKNVAMHVAATNPEYVNASQIPASIIEKEKEIAREQVKGKPENIMEKIVAGKLKAREDEICLVNQKFVMNPDQTVQQYVESNGKNLSVRTFTRWRVGQA